MGATNVVRLFADQSDNSDLISQQSLASLYSLKHRIKKLEEEILANKKLTATLEADILSKLTKNVMVEEGSLSVSIKETSRVVPAWKEAFIRVCGVEEALKITENTSPSVSKKIVIEVEL